MVKGNLQFYNKIQSLNHFEKENIRKEVEKEGSAFSLFPTMFSTLPKTTLKFLVIFIVWSANAFKFDRSEILSFDKELLNSLPHNPEF